MRGYIESNGSVGELVRQLETDFLSGTTTISKYVQFDMHDNIEKIDAYLNSKHTTGETDSLNREKPFFNIVTASVNIWYRATDIDRKNIQVKATKGSDTIAAFLASVHIQEWMKKDNFGSFLNEWGRVLARYGSATCKFIEKEGSLHAMVVPWNRLIVDPVEFDGNVTIEILELTEAQLRRKKEYDQEVVKNLCQTAKARENMDKTDKDNRNYYIKLYEVHGELPLSYITGDPKDSDTYTQQMHVVSYQGTNRTDTNGKKEYDDFTVYSGRESKHPYMITHLIKEDGRTLSIGAVEHLFEAQWMMNHSIKAVKDQLDLASKLIFQTSDGTFIGQNALTAIENGDILIHAPNQPLTQINNGSHDITAWQAFLGQWKQLGNEVTGVSEGMKGDNPPSGQAWRLTEALLQESHSLFELMTENKGLHIEEMFRNYVIPFIKKKMDSTKEVSATLEAYDIAKIDSKYIKNTTTKTVNDELDNRILNGEMPTPEEQAVMMRQMQGGMQEEMASLGNQRFFKPSDIPTKTWNEVFKDLEWRLEVDVTQEGNNAKDDLVTLSTVFQTIADPVKRQVLNTPDGKMLFNKILMRAGSVSPLELSDMPSPIQPQIPSPEIGGSGGNNAELAIK